MKLSNVSTDQLKEELADRGYFTENMFKVEDVFKHSDDINDNDAWDVLRTVLTNNRVLSNIEELIAEEVRNIKI